MTLHLPLLTLFRLLINTAFGNVISLLLTVFGCRLLNLVGHIATARFSSTNNLLNVFPLLFLLLC